MKKRVLYLLFSAMLVVFLFGCGGSGSSGSGNPLANSGGNPGENAANLPPVANAGTDQTVQVGDVAILDGTESYDPDENYPLSYAWQIISKPGGSVAVLSDPETTNPQNTAWTRGIGE